MVQMINENDALSKFFDIVYTEFTNREKTKREINFIKSHIDIGKVILDIGCGTGRHLIPLTKMRFNVVGIDNSKGMLGILKENKGFGILRLHGELSLGESLTDSFSNLKSRLDEAHE